jgi:hypothetical protein
MSIALGIGVSGVHFEETKAGAEDGRPPLNLKKS